MTSLPAAHKALLEPLVTQPDRSAILMDVDGTLAPIVDRPEDAAVPEETSSILADLAGRFALVACVTGRRALEARRMVGVDELVYIGNQGFELLQPGEEEPQLDPAAAPSGDRARKFLAGLDASKLERLGLRQEDKGPIQVLHWRGAPDETAAETMAEMIAKLAVHAGLIPLTGRKVLDLRPTAGIDKGSAVHHLLVDHAPLAAAIFAGDDRTDLDAFRAMARLAGSARLGAAVRVGVFTEESPAEIETEADLVVSGTDGVLEVLKALAQT
ncbi:MAG TPA: trehalose-phosphatase [Solirubrobacterales bacterium]|nr:trehalose-phosphatase [Solirubrobacterales bacterium]